MSYLLGSYQHVCSLFHPAVLSLRLLVFMKNMVPQVLFLLSYLKVTLLSVTYFIVSILYCLLFIRTSADNR